MSAVGSIDAPFGRATTRIARRLRDEAGFTLIEVLLASMMLMIVSAPIAAVLSQGAAISRIAGERTGADQLAQTQIESIRSLAYTQVGVTNGNPSGNLAASTSTTLPSGEAVTITRKVTWVSDAIPTAYVTNADYKKIVITVKRSSDGRQLSTKTTYIASASAPAYAGSNWVQIKRQLIDAVTNAALSGVSVNLTGGPKSVNRTDISDASGTVLFPALDSSTNSLPVYTLVSTLSGYYVFPDDISTGSPSSVPATPGLSSNSTIRMYLPTSLTVNVQNSSGAAWTSGSTISLASSRCGVQTQTISPPNNSTTFTTCQYATGKTVPLPPNVLGQVPLDDKYYVTAWSTNGSGNWSAGVPVTVPSGYPTTLTQTINVPFVTTAYATTKSILVTVTKGGSADANARVEVTGTPTGLSPGIHLYGTTNASGQVTIAVPVISTSTTFTISANDMGVQKGSNTVSLSTLSGTTTSVSVAIS